MVHSAPPGRSRARAAPPSPLSHSHPPYYNLTVREWFAVTLCLLPAPVSEIAFRAQGVLGRFGTWYLRVFPVVWLQLYHGYAHSRIPRGYPEAGNSFAACASSPDSGKPADEIFSSCHPPPPPACTKPGHPNGAQMRYALARAPRRAAGAQARAAGAPAARGRGAAATRLAR